MLLALDILDKSVHHWESADLFSFTVFRKMRIVHRTREAQVHVNIGYLQIFPRQTQ